MVKKDLRSKYRGKTLKDIQRTKEQQEVVEGEVRINQFDKDNYIKLDNSWNSIRIAPQQGEVYKQRVRYWVPSKDKDGKAIRKPVLSAIVHGNNKITADPVDTYIRKLNEEIKTLPETQQKEIAKYMKGQKTRFTPEIKYVSYAWKLTNKEGEYDFGKIGVFEYGSQIKEQIFDTIDDGDEESDTMEIDPFSDIDGYILRIRKDEEVSFDMYKVKKGKQLSLEDSHLAEVDKLDELDKRYDDVYTMDMFKTAIKGLETIDKELGVGLLENEELQEELEAIEKMVKKYGATIAEQDDEDEGQEGDPFESDEDDDEDDKPRTKKPLKEPIKKPLKKVLKKK